MNGTIAQTLAAGTFQNLTIANTNAAVTASGTSTVSGNLTVNSSCTFNDGGFIISVTGNVAGGGTCAGNGRILMNGTTKTISAGISLGTIEIASTSITPSGNFTINNDLIFSVGSFSNAGFIITVGGSVITKNASTTTISGGGKIVMTSISTISGVTAITITSGGTGYAMNEVVNFTAPASGTAATGFVLSVGALNTITPIAITDPGTGYTTAPTISSITTSGGSGFNITPVIATSTNKYIPGNRSNMSLDNLEINNSGATVSLTNVRQVTVTNNLAFNASNSNGRMRFLSGATLIIGAGGGATVTMAATNSFNTVAASVGNLTINSNTNIGTLYFDQTTPGTTNRLSQFTLTAGNVTLGNALQTNGNVAFDGGTLTLAANSSFLVNGTSFTRSTGVINASNSTSTFRLTTGSAITVPAGLFSPTTVANFVDSTNGTGTFAHTLGSAITVTNFKLAISNTGVFTCTNSSNLSIASAGSITMQRTNTGTIAFGTAPTFLGTVDLSYLGTQSISTGVELPTSTSAINNLTINNSAGVTLAANATVNGSLFLSSGTFTLTSTLTMANNSTIVRGQSGSTTFGTLSAIPTFGTGVNITILGTAAIASANELPTGISYGTITINNTNAYTIAAGLSITANTLVVGSGGVAGVLQYANTTTAINITVSGALTVGDGATFQCGSQSLAVVHILNVAGNISIGNNAIFTMASASGTSSRYTQVTFNSTNSSD
jgi:hypothetical protein